MKAVLLAAGLGTRLFPITKDIPKALVPVHGKPLLQHQLEKFKREGIQQVLINVHHFADQIETFLEVNRNFGLEITISDEREKILETGGALRKAAYFFEGNEPVLVHNVDVFTDISFSEMLNMHLLSDAMATLAVRNRITSRYLLFNPKHQLRGWVNEKTGEKKGYDEGLNMVKAAFSGIHILSPESASLFPDEEKFSIIDFYLSQMDNQTIVGFFHDEGLWLDVGKPDTLSEAERLIF